MAAQPVQPPTPSKVSQQAPPQPSASQPSQPPAQPAAPQQPGQKPASKKVKRVPPLPWLVIIFIILCLCQMGLLYMVRQGRNDYEELKKKDEDRILLLQKTTTVSQADINKLEEAFLDEKEIISFIQMLESVSLQFDTFDFHFTSDIPEGKEVKYLPFSLEVTGERNMIHELYESLLIAPYALEVVKFDVSVNEEDFSKESVVITGNMYTTGGTK